MDSFVDTYRPHSFDEMVGQKGIIGEFNNRSKEMNFSKALLLEGESGSGKTTAALIVAALINCTSPQKQSNGTHTACGECASCKDIRNEKFYRDVTFLDASTMGKGDVVAIEKIVGVSPMYDKNKIIIIDEAQELSKASKGATLKLLEKKRKNVHIILCTMDAKSIHKAVRDRCQQYKFRKLDPTSISEYLFKVLEIEDPDEETPEVFVTEGLTTIADNSDGSVRNALQHFERCLIGKFFTKEDIVREFGFVSDEVMFGMIFKILAKDATVLNEIQKVDMKEFFYKSRKILTDGMIYKMTQVSESEWKAANAKKIAKFDTVLDILSAYSKISLMSYFIDSVYLHAIIDYMSIAIEKTQPSIVMNGTTTGRTAIANTNIVEIEKPTRVRKTR